MVRTLARALAGQLDAPPVARLARSVAPEHRSTGAPEHGGPHTVPHRAQAGDEMDTVSVSTQIVVYVGSGHIEDIRPNRQHACQRGIGAAAPPPPPPADAVRCPCFGVRKNGKGTQIWPQEAGSKSNKSVFTKLIRSSAHASSGISKKGIEKVMVAERDGIKTVFLGEDSIDKKQATVDAWNKKSITAVDHEKRAEIPVNVLRTHARALGVSFAGLEPEAVLNAVLAEEGLVISGNEMKELHCENSELGALLDLDEHAYGCDTAFDQLLCYGDTNRHLNGSHGIVTLKDALKDDVAKGTTVTQVDPDQADVSVTGTVWEAASAGACVLIVAVNEAAHGSDFLSLSST